MEPKLCAHHATVVPYLITILRENTSTHSPHIRGFTWAPRYEVPLSLFSNLWLPLRQKYNIAQLHLSRHRLIFTNTNLTTLHTQVVLVEQ